MNKNFDDELVDDNDNDKVITSFREKQEWSRKARRKPLDIIHDLLLAMKQKPYIKKTRLMYKANLSHQSLEKYLSKLRKSELMSYEDSVFKVTEKGIEVLKEYNKMKNFLESFGID